MVCFLLRVVFGVLDDLHGVGICFEMVGRYNIAAFYKAQFDAGHTIKQMRQNLTTQFWLVPETLRKSPNKKEVP